MAKALLIIFSCCMMSLTFLVNTFALSLLYGIGQGIVEVSIGPPSPPSASSKLMITAIVASSLSSETERGDASPKPPGGPPPFELGPKLTHLTCFLRYGFVVRVSNREKKQKYHLIST